jgi:alpha-tubulin suppressor-like RCC1 family protein
VQILTGVVAVAGGRDHTLAIKRDGSLWAWGLNQYSQLGDGTRTDRLRPVRIMRGVVAIDGGYSHSVARKANGSLWAWGDNAEGQLGNGTTDSSLRPKRVAGFGPLGASLTPAP